MFGLKPQRPALALLFALVGSFFFAGSFVEVAAQDGATLADQPIGRDVSESEIAAWDIDIEPDGTGLPTGSGTVARGREIYDAKCVNCHGPTASENPGDTGINPNLANRYCCATTLFDYINRAMPYYAPQSLKPDEIYSLVAFLLNLNDIVSENFVADATTVPAVKMPQAAHYGVNPWTSGVIKQPGDPWSHDNP
ncbi:MAG: mono/diheme cytochrome c family protein [Planctomycetota bacterium]|jgi:mono/diheme cytochrome c family protein